MLPRHLIYQTLYQHRAWTVLEEKEHLDDKSKNVRILQNIPLISF